MRSKGTSDFTFVETGFPAQITHAVSPSSNGMGAVFDLYAGYNLMLGTNYLVGVQAEGSLAGLDSKQHVSESITNGTTRFTNDFDTHTKIEWMASALGRVGWLPDQVDLIYALGGWSYARMFNENSDLFFSMNGPTVGGGWERQIAPHWTMRAEYRYLKLDEASVDFASSASATNSFGTTTASEAGTAKASATVQTVRVGLSYLFNR